MSFKASNSNLNFYGGTFNSGSGAEKGVNGFKLLIKHVATTALHDSGGDCDPPRCMEGTRVAILDVLEGRVTTPGERPITWFHGSAGVGKTAIVRSLAERLAAKGLLLGDFFHFRADRLRNSPQYLIPTLAYQVCQSISSTQHHIEQAIESNPIIFSLALEQQLQTLVITPMILALSEIETPSPTAGTYHPHVILIDGLDECQVELEQFKILEVLSTSLHKFPYPIAILVASRPENNIYSAFETDSLKKCSSAVSLDNSFDSDADIRWFYRAKFRAIQESHCLRAYLPSRWPDPNVLELLVQKASGQFIFAETVTKFTGSARHNPSMQLEALVANLQKQHDSSQKPFHQLDMLYSAIFGKVDPSDLAATLHLLGIILLPCYPTKHLITFSPNLLTQLLDLEPGEVHRLLLDLGSLVLVPNDTSDIKVFHTSLTDYLFNESRSGKLFLNQGLLCADIATQYLCHPLLAQDPTRQFCIEGYFSSAAPTKSLHNAILQFNMDSITSCLYSIGDLTKTLRELPAFFETAIQESAFTDVKELANHFKRKWAQALKPYISPYWHNSTSRLILLATICPPYDYNVSLCMGHFIHLLSPSLSQEVVTLDLEYFQLLGTHRFEYASDFNSTLKEAVISTYGLGCFTDFAIQMWKLMLQNAQAIHNPGVQLSEHLCQIPGVKLDKTPFDHTSGHGDPSSLCDCICAFFPKVLDMSLVRADLTALLQHDEDIWKEYQIWEISAAIARYLKRATCISQAEGMLG